MNKTLVAFSTSWGSKFGGINSFNFDLLKAFAAYTYADTKTICVVLDASSDEIQQAHHLGVSLLSLGDHKSANFNATSEPAAWEKIAAAFPSLDMSQTVWLGHDRITGAVALAAKQKRGGRSALIHHMSYELYEGFAETSALARTKEDEQKSLFSAADIALAVGPLLRDALADMLDTNVNMLVPGLAEIDARLNPPKRFNAFLSGRLSEDAKKIKQAHLGVAAFGQAIHAANESPGLPDCLLLENQPKLSLRGVDFESRHEADGTSAEQVLKKFAESYAHCAYTLSALPFTTDRQALFRDLSAATVALMPSWHDGFGLVAWEAIAAGVPLIVSNKCGAYQLLKEHDAGRYLSWISPLTVNGSHEEPFFRDEDLANVRNAIIRIAKDPTHYKKQALYLREELLQHYPWSNCAKQLVEALQWTAVTEAAPQIIAAAPAEPVALAAVSPDATTNPAPSLNGLFLPTRKWRPGCGLSDSLLLRAEEAIIPFDPDREPFLQQQLAWAEAEEFPIAVRLLTGAGGVGKTRLALEMCERLAENGWQVGFLAGDVKANGASALAKHICTLEQASLIVLDYAETRQAVLLALLQALDVEKRKFKVRVLLVARDGGEWWAHLSRDSGACEALLEGNATTGPYPLPPLHDSLEARQKAYRLAIDSFAQCLAVNAPEHLPQLEEAHFCQPLYLQMSALIALRGERPESAEGLVRALVNHERRYWKVALAEQFADKSTLQECERQAALLIAIATLAGEIATNKDIEAVWQDAGGEKALLKPLFRLLAPLYPAERQGLQGLKPDLLGEALVAQVLLGAEGHIVLSAMLKQNRREWRHNSLTVAARLLRQRETLLPVVEQSLSLCFVKCVDEIVAVCIETASSLPSVVERIFANLTPSVKLQAVGLLAPKFQYEVLPLLELAVLVRQTIVSNKAKQRGKKPSLEIDAEYANELANLAACYHNAGYIAEALETAPQALGIQKKLAQIQPERFEGSWANSLYNHAIFLSENGQHEFALMIAKQALDVRQKLALNDPERFEGKLADSLIVYANRLANLGQHDSALSYTKQALDIYKRLAASQPAQYEAELAHSLANYGVYLADQGQYAPALTYSKQALDLRQKLAKENPGRFEADWANSISNYACYLTEQGQYEKALEYAKQALDLRQKLAQAKPERFEADWADSLSNYAAYLSFLGQWFLAKKNAEQATQIFQLCAQRMPQKFCLKYENSRLQQAFLAWLDDNNSMMPVLTQAVSPFDNPRSQVEFTYSRSCSIACETPNSTTINQALADYQALDKVQQLKREGSYFLLAAMATHFLGPDAAPSGWQADYEKYRQRLQGRIPQWMLEVARRLGFTMPA